MNKKAIVVSVLTIITIITSASYTEDLSQIGDTSTADVEFKKNLHISGHTTFRYDQYGTSGDSGSSLFGTTGTHKYQELSFSTLSHSTPYDKWQLDFSGLWNNSIYRSRNWGSQIERMRFLKEHGACGVPYRLEIGNIYGNFSYRTLQRSMIGAQIDFQPTSHNDRIQQSFVLLFGRNDQDWTELEKSPDRTIGFSWLWQRGNVERLAFNVVGNTRDGDGTSGILERYQKVFGLAYERQTDIFEKPAIIETEWAGFSGDHDGLSTPESGQEKYDSGFFAALSGGARPFTYRFRHEIYGQDFQPAGAGISPDRRSLESYLDWDLGHGRTLNSRWQYYKTGWETQNPLWNRTFGIGVRGPLDTAGKIYGGIDGFIETSHNETHTSDSQIKSIMADLSRSFSPRCSARLSLSHRHTDDHVTDFSDNRISQLTGGLDYAVRIMGSTGRLSLDLDHRLIDAGGLRSREYAPAIAISMRRYNHDFGIHYRFQRQDQFEHNRLDVDTAGAGFRWNYNSGDDSIGLEILQNHREDTNGIWNRSYQITGFWQRNFDTVIRTDDRQKIPITPETVSEPGKTDILTNYTLHEPFANALARIEGILGAPAQPWGDMAVFQKDYFADVSQRQRLILIRENNLLTRVALVIDVDGSIPGQAEDILARARRNLIELFGTPAEVYDRGIAGSRLSEKVRAGLFVRNAEWQLDNGCLRLGLPRRLDGRLRVEVQLAENFPPIRDNSWATELLD